MKVEDILDKDDILMNLDPQTTRKRAQRMIKFLRRRQTNPKQNGVSGRTDSSRS